MNKDGIYLLCLPFILISDIWTALIQMVLKGQDEVQFKV